MEHLFYRDGHDRTRFPSIDPTTEWLSFDHDNREGLEPISLADFHAYLPSRGWDVQSIWQGKLNQAHPSLAGVSAEQASQLVAAALQSWFTFGLLESALRKRVPVRNLVIANNKLYTLRLAIYFRGWECSATILLKDASEQKLWNDSVVSALTEANAWIHRISRWSEPPQGCPITMALHEQYPSFAVRITASVPAICRLGEAIDCGRRYVFRYMRYAVYPGLQWPSTAQLEAARRVRFLERGWCPFAISMLESTLTQSTLDWIDAEGKSCDTIGHSLYTSNQCARNNVDTQLYRTQHVEPDCCCPFVLPSLDAIIMEFKKGEIPVVRVNVRQPEGRGLDLNVSASQDCQYVAFSHVWADGMGSVSEDGLPTCQLVRLSKLAQKALGSSDAAFWIDSLCIPRQREWRKHAIISLYRTFRDAAAVVVIDRTVRMVPSNTTDSESVLLAIYASPWMQRLWTYQECLLARRLIFEMLDGLMHLAGEASRLPRSKMPETMRIVWQDLGKEIYRLQSPHGESNVGQMARALSWRSTTKADDETLAIGTVLGIDVGRLLKVDGEVRKMMFWKLVQHVPYNIIFLGGPKLSLRPFSWAPLSLMTRGGMRLDTDNNAQTARCTAQGLVGNYLVLGLQKRLCGDPNGKWYTLEPKMNLIIRLQALKGNGLSKSPGEFNVVAINSQFKTMPQPTGSKRNSAVALCAVSRQEDTGALVCNYIQPLVLECQNVYRTNMPELVGAVAKVIDVCIR